MSTEISSIVPSFAAMAKVAVKEHDRIVNTLDMIEALAPGLYEMRIEQQIGEGIDAHFDVACQERSVAALRALDDGDNDETPFALVDRLSRLGVDTYELTTRPLVQALVTPGSAEAMTQMHLMRLRRRILSDSNPMMPPVAKLAEQVRGTRKPAAKDNPFLQTEHLLASMVEQSLNFWSDLRSAQQELSFYPLYSNPFLRQLAKGRGADNQATDTSSAFGETLNELPQVAAALVKDIVGDPAEMSEPTMRMLERLPETLPPLVETRPRHRGDEGQPAHR